MAGGMGVGLVGALALGLGGGWPFMLVGGLAGGQAGELASRHWLTDESTYTNPMVKHCATLLARKLAGGLAGGLVFGLAFGLIIDLSGGLIYGLGYGLAYGVVGWLIDRPWLTDEPAYANLKVKHRATLLVRKLASWLAGGLMFGLVSGLVGGLAVHLAGGRAVNLISGLEFRLAINLIGGLAVGLGFGLALGLALGLATWAGTPSRNDWASTPQSTYKATRLLTVLQFSLAGLALGLAGGLSAWLANIFARMPANDLAGGPGIGVSNELASGLVSGLVGCLAVGLTMVSSGAWLSYLLAVCRLAASDKLPLRLMDFLNDAYRLGLLRTVGPLYQFRHAQFQDYLVRTADTQAAGCLPAK